MNTIIKRELILDGLGCAHCAAKIEREVRNITGVETAVVDFASSRLTIEVRNERDLQHIVKQAEQIARSIESDINIIYEETDDHEKEHGENHGAISANRMKAIRLAAGSILFGTAFAFSFTFWAEFLLYITGYLLVGGDIILKALKNMVRGRIFDENFLMSVATLGAFAIGEYPEGVAVMLFYQIGEFLQGIAVNRSRKSISALMNIRPDYANLRTENGIETVSPGEVHTGDIIIVKPGERVPLDGKVIEGASMIDSSALTGESVPREVESGDQVFSGSINLNGLLTIEVTSEYKESTVSKILDLVQNASARKAPTENFITRVARVYTPVVVFTALAIALVPPLFIPGAGFSQWVYRALIFLVVSCPCALVVSIPLGFFGGIGAASRNGILVKGSNYLEALHSIDTVVFDKTGTLTKGVFRVTEVAPQEGYTREELLKYAVMAESFSGHPIAASIQKAYGGEIDKSLIEKYDEIPGYGVRAMVAGKEILAGSERLMVRENMDYSSAEAIGTVVHVAIERQYAGFIVISDVVKEDSGQAIQALKRMGIRKTVMLTGDSRSVGERIGSQLGLDEVHAELLPDQKVEKMEELYGEMPSGGKLVYVGDGINDAPVLARADVGIAMGGLGSDAAIEAADIVLMTDEPLKLVDAVKIARRTRTIVWQNIVFALGTKIIVLLLGAGGMASMWEAVFADVGVTVIAVLNAMRVLRVKNE